MAPYGKRQRPRQSCVRWLAVLLREEGAVPAKDVRRLAREAGFSLRTLRRAKLELGVPRGRCGYGPGATYVWRHPEYHKGNREAWVRVNRPRRAGVLDQPLDVPPFSVVGPNKGGLWVRRRAAWLRLGVTPRAVGEPGYFDPVICECMLRWFTAPGWHVLDPWAVSTAPALVAARLGRRYTGLCTSKEAATAAQRAYAGVAWRPAYRHNPPPTWLAVQDRARWLVSQQGRFDSVLTRYPVENPSVGSMHWPAEASRAALTPAEEELVVAALGALARNRFGTIYVPDPLMVYAVDEATAKGGYAKYNQLVHLLDSRWHEAGLQYVTGTGPAAAAAIKAHGRDPLIWGEFWKPGPGYRPAF